MEDRPPSTVPEICLNRSTEQSSQEFCCGALNSIQAATHNWRVDVCSSGGSISCKACNRDLELSSISPGWRLLEAAAGVPSSQNGIRNPASASTTLVHCSIPDFGTQSTITCIAWPWSIREWRWDSAWRINEDFRDFFASDNPSLERSSKSVAMFLADVSVQTW